MRSFFRYCFVFLFVCSVTAVVSAQTDKEISIPVYPDSIHGTLLTASSKEILCIIHAGSGPTDRDGNNPYGLQTNCYKKLADSLYRRGISTFRFDKRGIGESRHVLEGEDSLALDTFVQDLRRVIRFFGRKDFGYKKIILLGHSEGALISTLAAQNNPQVSKLILVAGTGYRADTILKRQLAHISGEARKGMFDILDSLSAGKRVSPVPPAFAFLFRESVQNYMISWIKYDPAEELSKIKAPVLIVQGKRDVQVSEDNATALNRKCRNCSLALFPEMNHILVAAPADKEESKKSYANPDLPLQPGLVNSLIDFIKKP